ncbi:NAD(P)/FAD-dependent oxidoreductase [Microbacterium sp. CGR1]|uniref:NAD(P)/FAD-dependent oxidoreductase n=1 Tax=Microbacterium sp. CGR1 TaxID=1696072 RepID=UPI003DA4D222
MNEAILTTEEIVVVGAGMVAHRFVESLISRAEKPMHVTVIGDEGLHPYDRTELTGFVRGGTPQGLELDRSVFDDFRVRFLADDRVLRIDTTGRTVTTRSRQVIRYDTLVLATGSYAAIPEDIDGSDLVGCFVYRTLDDLERLERYAAARGRVTGRPLRGAIIGGGLLGLDAADALVAMGIEPRVFPHSEHLTSPQLGPSDESEVAALMEARGIEVRSGARPTRITTESSAGVSALELDDGSIEPVDVVLFAVGVRPRDELARNASIEVAPAGGIVIDERCRTSEPHILAIGEVAWFEGRCVGLLAPGLVMAEVATTRVLGGDAMLRSHADPSSLGLRSARIADVGESGRGDREAHEWNVSSSRAGGSDITAGRTPRVRALQAI